MVIHLNLGSNLGCREDNLGRAAALIKEAIPGQVTCSDIIETPAWGYESDHPFLNMGVMVETDSYIDPIELLHTLQGIQHAIDASPHRNESGGYIDRVIDIDIIAIDDLVLDMPELTLPHPRMHQRLFVLQPMAQLDPTWSHPLLHCTVGELSMVGELSIKN